MANAPNGAVSTIARTATVSTRSPQVKPNASGIPPIAAWTVAFGVYASIVNSLSFLLRLVPNRHTNTPNILNTNAPIITIRAFTPTFPRYPMFTVAPTSTNKKTSAATHSFPYFTESLFATVFLFFCNPMPINIIAINAENVIGVDNLSSITTSKNEMDIDAAKELLQCSRRGVIAVNGDDGYPYAEIGRAHV